MVEHGFEQLVLPNADYFGELPQSPERIQIDFESHVRYVLETSGNPIVR